MTSGPWNGNSLLIAQRSSRFGEAQQLPASVVFSARMLQELMKHTRTLVQVKPGDVREKVNIDMTEGFAKSCAIVV